VRFHTLCSYKTAAPVLALGLGALLVGCGNSSPKASSTPSPKASTSASSTPTATSTGSSALSGTAGTIAANWESFFSGKTSAATKVSLLENGSQFAKIIDQQSGSSMATTASAKVTGVTGITSTAATVAYSIDLAGTPALPDQSGQAVYQDASWKVGDKSFCALLALELGKNGLPAACSSS
jgi:hypothetical protein